MSIDFLPNRAGPEQRAQVAKAAAVRDRLFNPPNRILPLQVVEHEPKPVPTIRKRTGRDVLNLSSVHRPLKWRHIVDQVVKKHGVTLDLMIGETRRKDVYLARWELFARLYEETGMSLPQIGKLVRKDHSTVFQGIKRYYEMRDAGE